MRLLQVSTTFGPGGIQRHVLDLGTWLRGQGHHVSYAGSPRGWLDEREDPDFLALPLDKVSWEGGNSFTRAVNLLKCAIKLRSFIGEQRIDLIHAHESAPALVAWLASIGKSVPIITTYHGSEPERIKEFGRVAHMTSDLVISPSHRTAADLHEQAGVPEEKLKVIGLGISQLPPDDGRKAEQLRQELLDSGASKIVVMVARLARQKGIDVLIDAVQRLAKTRQDIKVVVVGDGPLGDQVGAWAEQAGVGNLIDFVGTKNNVPDYLRAADMFLLTSRWEALPISIVEAFRAGLPVVATDCGGVHELVIPEVGKVLPIEDAEGIASAILELCSDDSLRAKMAAAAAMRSREDRFSPDHINRLFETTYEGLINYRSCRQ